jgi:hypothetical protein
MPKRRREEAEAVPADGDDESIASAAEEALAAGIVQPPPAKLINNKAGLRQALADVRQQGLPWIERLEVVSAEPLGAVDVNDDLKLELAL